MTRPLKFDVFRAGIIGGTPLGQYIATIEALDHSTAKDAAEELYRGIAAVVVLPAGRADSISAPVTIRYRRADGGRSRTTHPRPRP